MQLKEENGNLKQNLERCVTQHEQELQNAKNDTTSLYEGRLVQMQAKLESLEPENRKRQADAPNHRRHWEDAIACNQQPQGAIG